MTRKSNTTGHERSLREALERTHTAALALLNLQSRPGSPEEDVVQDGLRLLARLFGARCATALMHDPDGGEQRLVSTGLCPGQGQWGGSDPFGLEAGSLQVLRIDELQDDPRSEAFARQHPHLRSLLSVPLADQGGVYGRVYLCDAEDGAPFGEEDERRAAAYAEVLAGIIGRARLAERDDDLASRIDYLTHHDALTGLPNRTLLVQRLERSMQRADRYRHLTAVLVLNLDRFKVVNDSLGRDTGDRLIRMVAERLVNHLRADDIVSRQGADEFVLVLADVADLDHVGHVARSVTQRFREPVHVDGHELYVSLSIGVGIHPGNGDDAVTLLQNADAAMHHAKESGGNSVCFFASEMNRRMQHRLALETALARAVEQGEFRLYYQPQVSLSGGVLSGAEALLRWYPGDRVVGPAEFIGLAETSGLIVSIGEWVLREACRQYREWMDAGLEVPHISINLSARQFREPGLVESIEGILGEFGLSAAAFGLEITESALMHEPEAARKALDRLRAMGFKVLMDDFGTGYSSLSFLRRFPVDTLKIDRSFVQNITVDPGDAAIARAVIDLAHGLGIGVVAEGVETEAQLAFLRRSGCDAMQGYYFSKALPPEDFTHLLRKPRRLDASDAVPEAAENTLLLVDDESNILRALRRLLRRDGYSILTANGPAEALELLARHAVGVIVSDQRMPGMTGTEFFGRVRRMYPDTMRIILSGYAELAAVTDAINRGAVYRFLTKPWDEEELRRILRDAFRQYRRRADGTERAGDETVS